MNELLKTAFEFAGRMEIVSNQQSILKEEFKQNLVYYTQGGSFTSSKEFISFIKTLIDLNNVENIVVIDNNETPILIPNLQEFLTNIVNCYFSASNEFYTKYVELTNQKTAEGAVFLND